MQSWRIVLVLVFLNFGCISVFAQAPVVEWSFVYEEPNISQPGIGVFQLSDGSYIAGSASSRHGQYGLAVLKFNSEGDTLWTQTTSIENHNEDFTKFYAFSDTMFGAVGTYDDHGDYSAHFILLDSTGLRVNGCHYNLDYEIANGEDVDVFDDSMYVLCGVVFNDEDSTSYDIMMMGLDTYLVTLWDYVRPRDEWQALTSITTKIGGGYLSVGYTQDIYNYRNNGLLVIASNCGGLEYLAEYGNEGDIVYRDVEQLPDSSYVIAGHISYEPYGQTDALVRKYNADNTVAWTRMYGGEDDDQAECIQVTPDGGFVVAGFSILGTANYWVLRLNADGDTLWTKLWGTNRNDRLGTIALTDDGGYIVSGSTREEENIYRTDLYVAKLAPDQVGVNETDKNLPTNISLMQNYPNPFNATTTINFTLDQSQYVTLKIYDLLGREIATLADGIFIAGNHEISYDASNLASGTYLYKLKTENSSIIKKMLLIK